MIDQSTLFGTAGYEICLNNLNCRTEILVIMNESGVLICPNE